jgi:hypothetical protein
VIRRWSKRNTVWVYLWNLPGWARAAGCPIANERLGTDYNETVKRAETVLLPAFDAWRGGEPTAEQDAPAKGGTLDWLFGEYRASRKYTKLPLRSQRDRESNLRLVGSHIMNNGRRFGTVQLAAITTVVVDALFERLLIVKKKDAHGNVIEIERRTTVNTAMKTCRRAWNIVARSHPGKLPLVNPFAEMELKGSNRETPTATYAELQAFRAKAKELGYSSLATAALIGWEWVQRRIDIFARFDVTHYRPKDRSQMVRVLHEKTGEENWIPLFDDKGVPLYPELMAELDAIKRERIAGLMIRRDWGERAPWPPWPIANDPKHVDLSMVSEKVKEIMRAAGTRSELTFTSFRHGGFTEMGDAELSDPQIRAQGRLKSTKILPRYVKRTARQVAEGTKKRRAIREEAGTIVPASANE